MDRDKALSILRAHKAELAQHHVQSLAIFGSVARNEASSASDIDLLVEFDRPVGLFEFVRLQKYLSTILSCSVDLATPNALHASMRDGIREESVYA